MAVVGPRPVSESERQHAGLGKRPPLLVAAGDLPGESDYGSNNSSIYRNIYLSIFLYIYPYIYIYMYRERER